MTGVAQAVHVALKDVRVARWWIAGWLLLLAAALADALRMRISESVDPGLMALLTVAGAMLVAAVFVQQDAPLEADAFWATRPLSPLAVWLGKLLAVAGVIMLPALAAQTAAMLSLDADVTHVLSVLGGSTAVLALWISLAMAVAASTRSMRHFVLATLAVFIGLMVILTFHARSSGPAEAVLRTPGIHHHLWRGVWPLLLIAIVAWHYRRRLPQLGLPAILLAGAITAPALHATLASPWQRWSPTPDAPPGAIDLSASILSIGELHGGVAQYVLEVEADPAHRHALSATQAYIQREDGRRDAVGIVQSRGIAAAELLPDATIRLAVNLQAPQVELLERGRGHLLIIGDYRRQQVHALPLLPLEVGSVVSGRGVRAALAAWEPSPATAEVVVTYVGAWGPRLRDGFQLALVGGARGSEEIPLRVDQSHNSPRFLVLPSGAAHVVRLRAQPYPHAGAAAGAGTSDAQFPSRPMLRITELQDVERRVARITVKR